MVTFPWLTGCSCSYSTSGSVGTTSANAVPHRPERHHKRKAPQKESETQGAATADKAPPPQGSIGASASKARDTAHPVAPAQVEAPIRPSATAHQAPIQQTEAPISAPTPAGVSSSTDQTGYQRKPLSEAAAAPSAASGNVSKNANFGSNLKPKTTDTGDSSGSSGQTGSAAQTRPLLEPEVGCP